MSLTRPVQRVSLLHAFSSFNASGVDCWKHLMPAPCGLNVSKTVDGTWGHRANPQGLNVAIPDTLWYIYGMLRKILCTSIPIILNLLYISIYGLSRHELTTITTPQKNLHRMVMVCSTGQGLTKPMQLKPSARHPGFAQRPRSKTGSDPTNSSRPGYHCRAGQRK